LNKLQHRTNAEGILRIVSSEKRSQLENKEQVKEKFRDLIRKAVTPKKKRKQTAPSAQSNEERIRKKKLLSEKKKLRVKFY
jgi:ribosome-associated protein